MNYVRIFIINIVLTSSLHALFDHDKAVCAAQQGDYARALSLLQRSVTNTPDDPSVVYDAGVAAYKTGDLEQADAYFSATAESPKAEQSLREQAYFNRGNVHATQKKYREAIEDYTKALEINPDNERTKHNLEIVKKLLQEQQKQEQQQQKKDNDKDKDKSQQQQDKDQQNKNNDDQQDNDDDNNGDQQSQSKSGGKGDSPEQEKAQKKDGRQDKGNGSERERKDEGKQKGDQGERDKPKQNMQQPDKQNPGDSEREKQQRENKAQHAKSNEKQKQQEQSQQGSVAQNSAQQQDSMNNEALSKLDARLVKVLAEQEKHDAQLNKKMIKATVGNTVVGYEGQNCW